MQVHTVRCDLARWCWRGCCLNAAVGYSSTMREACHIYLQVSYCNMLVYIANVVTSGISRATGLLGPWLSHVLCRCGARIGLRFCSSAQHAHEAAGPLIIGS